MRLLIRVIVLLILVLAIGLASIWLARNSASLRDLATQLASSALGRAVAIGRHQIDIRDGQLKLTIENAVVEQPANFSGPAFFAADQLEVEVALADVFKKPVFLESVRASNPIVRLNKNAAGEVNWLFTLNQSDVPASQSVERPSLPLFFRSATIDGLQVSFIQPDRPLVVWQGDVNQGIEGDHAVLDIDSMLNDTRLVGSFSLAPVSEILAIRKIAVEGRMNYGEVTFSSQANFVDVLTPSRPTLNIDIKGPSIEYLTDLLGMDRFTTGPLDVEVDLARFAEETSININGEVGEFALVASGTVDHILNPETGHLAVSVSGPDASRVAAMFTAVTIPEVPFSMVARVDRDGPSISIEDARVSVGRLQFDASATIPDISTPARANIKMQASVPDISIYNELIGAPVDFSGPVTTLISVNALPDGSKIDATLESDYGDYEVTGIVSSANSLRGSQFNIAGNNEDIDSVAALFDIPVTPEGAWDIELPLTIEDEGVSFTNARLRIAADSVETSGVIPFNTEVSVISVSASAKLKSLRPYLSHWLASTPAEQLMDNPMTGNINLTAKAGVIDLQVDSLDLGSLAATGRVSIDTENLSTALVLDANSSSLSGFHGADWLHSQFPKIFNDQLAAAPFSVNGELDIRPPQFALNNVNLRLGSTRGSGSFVGDADASSFDLSAELKSTNMLEWLQKAPTGAAIGGEVVIDGSFRPEQWTMNKLEVRLEDNSTLFVEGTYHHGESFDNTDLKLTSAIADVSHFSDLLGVTLPPENLSLDLLFEGDQEQLNAKNFSISSGESEITGSLNIANPSRPVITMSLSAPSLDLRPYTKPRVDTAGSEDETATPQTAQTTSRKRTLIPETPIDLGVLNTFDADITLDIGLIQGHTRDLDSLDLHATVSQGNLIIEDLQIFDETSGRAQVKGFASTINGLNHFGLRLSSEEINIGVPILTPEDIDALPRYDMRLAVYGSGDNTRDLAASVSGGIEIIGGQGRIVSQGQGLLTNAFLDELLTLVNPLRESDPYNQVECLAALASIKDGKLKGDPLVTFVTNKLAVISKAELDFASEKVFATFNTVPQRGFGISASSAFNPFVGVGGTLAEPQVTLDPEGTIIQGSLAVATGGISLIGKSVLDRFTVSKKSCDKELKKFASQRQQAIDNYASFRAKALTPAK